MSHTIRQYSEKEGHKIIASIWSKCYTLTVWQFPEIYFLAKISWKYQFYYKEITQYHTVLAISIKSPENKDLEILDFLIKIDFDITFTL